MPLGAAAIVVALRRMHHDSRIADRARLDLPGTIGAVIGLTALTSGIVQARERGWIAPAGLATLGIGAGALMQRLTGRSAIAFGTVIAAMEFGWQAVTATALYRGDLQVVLGPAVLISIDAGLLTTPITTTVTSGIPSRDAGAPSGLENTTKQIGGALGFASLIVVAAPAPDRKLDYIPVIASMAAILITIAIIALPIPRQYDRDSTPG